MKKIVKEKNGFTLIELLAVIAILAILVIFALPTVLKLYKDAMKNSFEIETENILKAAEQGYAVSVLKGNVSDTNYTYIDGEEEKTGNILLKLTGRKIQNGEINITKTGNISFAISDGKYCGVKSETSEEIIVNEDIENCIIPVEFAEWNSNFGGSNNDKFYKVVATVDGYVAVGDSSSTDGDLSELNKGGTDAIIVKYSIMGNVVWRRTFGGSDTDRFYGVTAVNDGYVAVGFSYSADGDLSGYNWAGDGIIVKYDTAGTIMWQKYFRGNSFDSFAAIQNISNGFIVVGDSYSTSSLSGITFVNKGERDGIIVKYDTAGNLIWNKNYGGSTIDYFEEVSYSTDGYIAVGSSKSSDGDINSSNQGEEDAIITKYNTTGDILWSRSYGGSLNDYFRGITSTENGYIAVGNSRSINGDLDTLNKGSYDGIVIKYTTDGDVTWKRNYGGSSGDYFYGIASTIDGYTIVGNSSSTNGDLEGLNKGGTDAIMVKYNTSGNVVLKKNYGGTSSDYFYGLASNASGCIPVGNSYSTDGDMAGLSKGGFDSVIFTIKD